MIMKRSNVKEICRMEKRILGGSGEMGWGLDAKCRI